MKKENILVIIPALLGHKNKKYTQVLFQKKNTLIKLGQASAVNVSVCFFFNESNQLSVDKFNLHSVTNIGFTGAVNAAVVANFRGKYDWFLILNDDADLKVNFFEELQPFLKRRIYSVISCGVEDREGNVESYGLKYYKTGLAFPIRNTDEIDNKAFCGTCFLLSKKFLENQLSKHGYLFRPEYFAYAEDLELSLRMKDEQQKIYIHPEVLVTHQVSQTAKRGSEFQLYYSFRNLLITMYFHFTSKELFQYFPKILIGQLYMVGLCVYKGYYLLYFRIIWYMLKHKGALAYEKEH